MIRIANAAGFWGDWLEAPRRLVAAAEVDYLTLEYLAELTLSILAAQRERDPLAGYASDFLDVLTTLVPALHAQPQLRIVTNAGGTNPLACARAAADLLTRHGLGATRLGVVSGDDITAKIPAWQAAGYDFANLDSGQPLSALGRPLCSAHAYLGAGPIADALGRDARIVITGRVADASLTLGPALHAFGWSRSDWHRLAGASVAGHLIECGAQVTGGYSVRWQDYDLVDVGYPIAELAADGSSVITKPPGTGGGVDRRTVVEQLVYEIGDPAHYLTPDVDVDFTAVEVEPLGPDRVAVRGAAGRPPPDTLKVSAAYRDGFQSSGQLLVAGPDCVAKARATADILLRRLELAGFRLARTHVELLGESTTSVVLRIAAHDPDRAAVERFTKEFAPLITSGPAGLAGYAVGRSPVRPVFAYWPTCVPRAWIEPVVQVAAASDWQQ